MKLNPAVTDLFAFPLRGLRARRLRAAPAHQGARWRCERSIVTIRPARPGEAGARPRASCASSPNTRSCRTSASDRGDDRCGAVRRRSRACSATSPNGTARRPASRSGSTTSRPSAAATASISRTCSCGRRIAARASARRCWSHLAQRCVDEGWARFEWSVLDWNTPSIEFYKSLGAVLMDEWTGVRVSGDALAQRSRGATRDADRPRRRGRRERRDRPRQRLPWRLKSDLQAFPRAHHRASRS